MIRYEVHIFLKTPTLLNEMLRLNEWILMQNEYMHVDFQPRALSALGCATAFEIKTVEFSSTTRITPQQWWQLQRQHKQWWLWWFLIVRSNINTAETHAEQFAHQSATWSGLIFDFLLDAI